MREETRDRLKYRSYFQPRKHDNVCEISVDLMRYVFLRFPQGKPQHSIIVRISASIMPLMFFPHDFLQSAHYDNSFSFTII